MTPQNDEIVALVARVLYPWVEEVQGEKFAAHDAMRQAEQVVGALREAGHIARKAEGE